MWSRSLEVFDPHQAIKEEIERKSRDDEGLSMQRVLDAGYEDVILLSGYDDALIGVTEDGRAVYAFDKMVDWLMETEDWSWEEAVEWIEYNTIRSLPYMGPNAPIVMYPVE